LQIYKKLNLFKIFLQKKSAGFKPADPGFIFAPLYG